MTVGSQLDLLLVAAASRTAHLNTLLLVSIPLLILFIFSRLRTPRSERAVVFPWTVPEEVDSSWSSTVLPNPSLNSHLSDHSLLPPSAKSESSRSYITAYAPASAQHLATVPSLTRDEIEARIGAAVLAQQGWRNSSWARRRRVMRSLLEWCVKEMEPLAKIASRDSGKTLVDASFGEILTTCEKLRWVIANGEEILRPEQRPTPLILAHKKSKVVYEPLGVVAAIVSWNYSFHNALSPIIASLFSGNAIVVKPSENVAWSSLIFIEAVRSCLSACGEDPELVQVVVTLPDSVEALTGDSRIKHITFIGSEEIGKKVAIKAAEVGTPVLLELGGKDPCILLPSADTSFFTNTWMRGVFQSMSQNCIGIERFIVHSSLYDSFVDNMAARVADLRPGDVLAPSAATKRIDVGAMVTDRLFDKLEELIEDAVRQGARCLVGGKRAKKEDVGPGHYFQPTLLVDVSPDSAIAQQETFAPVMLVLKPYEALEEAVSIANGTRYGLGASVFGKDKKQCQWVMERLDCGMVCSNDFGVFYLNQALPFGGTKASGNALRFAGPEGLRGLCNLKAVTEDRFHGIVQTGIPPLLAYPIANGASSWKFVSGLVQLMYGAGVRERAKGVWKLITAK